jgi:hypothetical protein
MQVVCGGCGAASRRYEACLDLQLEVPAGVDRLEDALARHTAGERDSDPPDDCHSSVAASATLSSRTLSNVCPCLDAVLVPLCWPGTLTRSARCVCSSKQGGAYGRGQAAGRTGTAHSR